MNSDEVRTFLGRTRALVDRSPPETLFETRLLIVEPLLYCLGWDTYDRSCRFDVAIGGETIEYDCTIDGISAVFVAIESFDDSLSERRIDRLESVMADTGVDRAIYVNGRQVLFLAGTDPVERITCEVAALAEHEQVLRQYTIETARARLADHARELTARKLAGERENLVETITEELVDVGGSYYESEIETVVDRFLDRLIGSFHGTVDRDVSRSRDADTPPTDGCENEDDPGDTDVLPSDSGPTSDCLDSKRTAESVDGTDANNGIDADDGTDAAIGSGATSPAETPEPKHPNKGTKGSDEPEDTEYVVRFFAEQGSIGGISHSRSDRALVHAVEFLFERGLSGVRLPWTPDDEKEVVLSNEPIDENGTQLSNGVYLNTGGPVEHRARRVEQLASRAGLRAMLVGDWGKAQSDADDGDEKHRR